MVANNPQNWQAVVYQDEDGAWCAEVPAMPGCVSCGDNRDDAIRNIQAAASLWLEAQREMGRDVPRRDTPVEVVAIKA